MGRPVQRTNDQWLADLNAAGAARDAALADLRGALRAGLPHALAGWLAPDDPHFEALIEETAQETLLRVLARLGQFEGRSRFTTWVQAIAVRIALSELRRRRWRDVSFDSLWERAEAPDEPAWAADPSAGPERQAERADAWERLRRILEGELTPRQRRALAAMMRGMPLEEVARRMGTQRNALYKLLHDARLKVRRRMQREGLPPGELMALFEET
jgi:RNA polymerase sigma-70 factor, ECF subfamily